MTETIYRRPADYDLEHEGDDEDVECLTRLVRDQRPRTVLELGAGSGRLALPLARAGAQDGFHVTGLELADEMRRCAAEKLAGEPEGVQEHLTLTSGDMRSWHSPAPCDVIVCACSSVAHLLTLDDQLATWGTAFHNLSPGGLFIVDVVMPHLPTYADSMQTPPRTLVELDLDNGPEAGGTRMLRYKVTEYIAHEQRARIRFLYDKFPNGGATHPSDRVERYVSDFESHVYFPREIQLLFLTAGFALDTIYGDYRLRSLRPRSPQMIVLGRRPQ